MFQSVESLITYSWFDAAKGVVYGKLSGRNSDMFQSVERLRHVSTSEMTDYIFMIRRT